MISETDDSSTEPAKIEMQREKRMKEMPPSPNRIKHPWTLEQYLKVLHVCNVNTRHRMKKEYGRINVWSNDQAFSKMNRYQHQTQEVQRISNRINTKKNLISTYIDSNWRRQKTHNLKEISSRGQG